MDPATLSAAVGLASAAYLAGRTAVQMRRQRRSYIELPFGADLELTEAAPRVDRARGALLGVALGDALGAPREGLPVGFANQRYGREPTLSRGVVRFMRRRGTVTDDTQHTWLVARCIRRGTFDEQKFAELLVDWLGWRIGEGRGTLRAVRALRTGRPNPNRGQGNGAAMRVAPIAVAFHDDIDAMVDVVRRASAATHPDPEAIAGAEVLARATRALLADELLDAATLTAKCRPEVNSCALDDWDRALDRISLHYSEPGIGGIIETTGWVFASVPAALLLWLRHPYDHRAGLRELYAFGGDTDTIGAMYLSLIGARHGASHFAASTLVELQGAAALVEEADRLQLE